MRLTHSSLFALTTVITSSLLYQVQSAPLNEVDTVADKDHVVVAFDVQSQNQHNGLNEWTQHLDKRCGHSHVAARRRTHKKKTTRRKSHKKKKVIKKKTTHKKKTTKRKTTKRKTTKRKTTHKKKTTKRKTTKKTVKKTSSSSGEKFSGDGTYYTPGLGSCGITNTESEMVAAMNAPQMNNGANPNLNPLCGKYITVKGPKGSVRVKIVDTCPPCAKGDIDLSVGAFGKVGSYIDGRIPITWEWS